MKYDYLGQTGLKVSRLCLGTMQFGWTTDEAASRAVLKKAYDSGLNFIDTANVYTRWSEKSYAGKSDEIIGRWLKESGNRDQIILATKVRGEMGTGVNDSGLSRRHIMMQIAGSLKRLQTSWVDLYQTHRTDENIPIRETLSALTDLVHDGKVHAIGCSNYPSRRLKESLWVADRYNLLPYQTLQPQYSLANRSHFEESLQAACKNYKLAVIPYSPLGAGFLTGKYKRGQELPISDRAKSISDRFMNDRGYALLEVLGEISKAKGAPMAQIALAWLLSQETIVSPIIGANTVEQLEELLGAVDISLTAEELKRLTDVSAWKQN